MFFWCENWKVIMFTYCIIIIKLFCFQLTITFFFSILSFVDFISENILFIINKMMAVTNKNNYANMCGVIKKVT
ncbi:hypothetical protein CRI66_16505 [Escherichia sp. E4694]|nr:hypothetical protein CRI66_16505 [Escherichia sp. E4694]